MSPPEPVLLTAVAMGIALLGAALLLARARGLRGALALFAFYLPQALLLLWGVHDLARWGLGAVAGVLASLALAVLLAHRLRTYAGAGRPGWADLPWFSTVHILQTAMLVGLVVWPVSRLAPPSGPLDLGAIMVLIVGSALALAWTHTALGRDELEAELPGLTRPICVAQISDLHVGPYTRPSRLRRIAAEITAMEPDLVVFTGDMLTLRSEGEPGALLAFVDALPRPALGTWACLGNHDMAGAATMMPALEARGVRVLVDAAVDLADPALRVVGLGWHPRRARAGYGETLGRLLPTDGRPTLVLCHDPAAFDHLPRGWRGLMLAGHLHGGQVGWRFSDRSVSLLGAFGLREQGMHRAGESALYVHRGTGTYGFPVRFGVAPELARLVLLPETTGASRSPR